MAKEKNGAAMSSSHFGGVHSHDALGLGAVGDPAAMH